MIRIALALLLTLGTALNAAAQALGPFEDIATPAGPGAREPALFALDDGRLIMSWMEPSAEGFAVMTALRAPDGWSVPRRVISSADLFVNWADAPSVAAMTDGTLVIHWLQKTGPSPYAYEIRIAFSHDDGLTWSDPIVPHRDGTQGQHGFVTLVPVADGVVAIWLDGRAGGGARLEEGAIPDAMQLRATFISPQGGAGPDLALDLMTCSCCNTAAARSGADIVVLYRDRTEAEIRDIAVIRLDAEGWGTPQALHSDGWEIAGCPVNGPAIAARGADMVAAWFTGAEDIPAIKVARSADGGRTFGQPVRIDMGQPVGRVEVLMPEGGDPLVAWVEWTGSAEALMLCTMGAEGCNTRRELALNSAGSSINFPAMAATAGAVYIAWTQPLPGGGDSIRMIAADR